MKIIKSSAFFFFFGKLSNTFKILALLSFFLFLFLFPISTLALSTGGVGGYPAHPDPSIERSESWFIFNLDLGEIGEDALLVFNTSDETKTVKLYAVDSVPSNQGNFALANEDAEKKDLGAWIEMSENFVTLEPGESQEIPFTITVPEEADAGEHSGGIIIQKSSQAEAMGQTGASIVTRVGIRIYNTVPGEIVKAVELTDFGVERIEPEIKEPFYRVTLSALNKSTVSLNPKVDLGIKGWGKIDYSDFEDLSLKKLKSFIGGEGDFPIHFFSGETLTKNWQLLREQKVITYWEWPEPEFGRFTFQVKLTYQGNEGEDVVLTSPAIVVWVIPWVELGVIAGVIVLIIILIFIRRVLYSGRKWISYTVQRNDRLVTIARRGGISWKKLAKVNKLPKPYSVELGQKILVPPTFKSSAQIKLNQTNIQRKSNGTKINSLKKTTSNKKNKD